jgi:hypothetical protein
VKILIVGDDRLSRLLLSRALERPVRKALSETCRDQEVAGIQKRGGQLTRELRILQDALEVMRHEQARFKSSSRAGNYYLPIARGMIWKLLADKTATAVSK